MMKRLPVLLAMTAFWAGTAMAQQLVRTKMDFEDLKPIALPDFGHTGDQKPLSTTPEGANARAVQCSVLTNSPFVPGNATTVIGNATGSQPFGLQYGETIQMGFGQPVSDVSFMLINNIPGGIIGGKAVTGQTFRIYAQDNAFHSQTQQITLGLVQAVKVSITLPEVRFISVTPLPVNGPVLRVLYWQYFLDDFEFNFQPLDTSKFEFTLGSAAPQRVLIHKYRTDDTYPSSLQKRDRQIAVDGFVRNSAGMPIAGKTVYFRLSDPPDPAQYVVSAGDSGAGDNVDGTGTLSTLTAVSDANGYASVDLTVTDHVAGDNYVIEASLDPAFNCGSAGCPKSAIYTAWKRFYIEKKRMFAQGAFITKPVLPGDTEIFVSDLSQFATGDHIRLVHAPPYVAVYGPPAPGAPQPAFSSYSEDHVIAVRPPTTRNGIPVPARLEILPNPAGTPDPIRNFFGRDPAFASIDEVSDGIGVIGASGPTAFPMEDSLIPNSFSESFVEYKDLQQAVSEVPFIAHVSRPILGMFVTKWVDVSAPADAGSRKRSKPNHSLILATSELDRDPTAPNGQPGAELGVTPAMPNGFMYSVIWAGRIQRATADAVQPIFGQAPLAVEREVIVHELTHQWRVNPILAAGATSGHCLEQRFQNDGRFCLMHIPVYDPAHNAEFSDGQVSLHYLKTQGNVDSEYVTIRRAAEPAPTN